MKKLIYFFTLLLTLMGSNLCFSQIPSYVLRIWELREISNNELVFDIRIEHTNAPTAFEYSAGQYFITVDTAIANGGTLSYSIIGSDLPPALQPRNPSIEHVTNPPAYILKLESNPPPGAGNGYIMTNNGPPGTRVVTMKLTTSTSFFVDLGNYPLQWRNPPITSFATKIFANVAGTITDITTPATHQGSHEISINSIKIFFTTAMEGLFDPQTLRHSRNDSLTIYLRDAVSPYAVRDSFRSEIDSISRSADAYFYDTPSGTYYIVIKHLNSIETWTREGGVYLEKSTQWSFGFDFVNINTWAYGQNVKHVGNVYCIYTGDVNQDGAVDIGDLSLIDNDSYNFISDRFLPSDLNGDNIVDLSDLLLGENNAINYVRAITPLAP